MILRWDEKKKHEMTASSDEIDDVKSRRDTSFFRWRLILSELLSNQHSFYFFSISESRIDHSSRRICSI
jgi:hypothetical protein